MDDKLILADDMLRRLAKQMGVTIDIAKEIQRCYSIVYLEAIRNKEGFKIPGIGSIHIKKLDMGETVYLPKSQTYGKRVNSFRIKYYPSKIVEAIKAGRDGKV